MEREVRFKQTGEMPAFNVHCTRRMLRTFCAINTEMRGLWHRRKPVRVTLRGDCFEVSSGCYRVAQRDEVR